MTTPNEPTDEHPSKGYKRLQPTQLEQRIRDAVQQKGERLDPFLKPAWYFLTNFENVTDGRPVGQLLRYEAGDLPFEPAVTVDVPGTVIGDVRFEGGRAFFDGRGHIEFKITDAHAEALDKAKIEVSLISPKPLSMLGYGGTTPASAETPPSAAPYQNPVLYYQCGSSGFGLFTPDGTIMSKINLEEQSTRAGMATRALDAQIWFAYIEERYEPAIDGKRYRLAHKVVDPNQILDYEAKREFFLYETFRVPLEPGATFYVGGAPTVAAAPFRGWLEEVVFDPTGTAIGGR